MSTLEKAQCRDKVELEIRRPALNVTDRRLLYGYQAPQEQGLTTRCSDYIRKELTCSPGRVRTFVKKRIPITDWLPNYQWKRDILGDTVAGITVAILHIPQGMGFALLANIPAICGIYMAFFPVIAYALLATSHHNSMGAFAIMTMMTGDVVNRYATFPQPVSNTTDIPIVDTTTSPNEGDLSALSLPSMEGESVTYTPIQVASIVCFMSGVWGALLGFCSLGSVTVFFNDMLVSAFSFGAALHVLTSQVPDMLGVSIGLHSGAFKLTYTYMDIFSQLPEANLATVVISAVSVLLLCLNNELLKPRLAKVTRIPMPIELIVVVLGTAVSYLSDLPEKYGVSIVGDIPTGLPAPSLPPLSLAPAVGVDGLVIAVVAYAGSYSLAKIFGDKHDYPVDANQELYAMGFGNIFSSFFSCAPMASAISRVLIQDSVGGVTQLACLITSFVILWVLLFLGPLFEYLPKACLASIIVVALKNMFLLIFSMFEMWRLSKIDSVIWIVTALSVIILDVGYGLIIGLVFVIAILLHRGQHPKLSRVSQVQDTDVYVDRNFYADVKTEKAIVIVKVEGALHFANRENFKSELEKVAEINLKIQRDEKCNSYEVQYLVLDCQGLSSLDSLAAKFLQKISTIYSKVGVKICLTALCDDAYEMLSKMGTLEVISENQIFHSVHDAVAILKRKMEFGEFPEEVTKV